MKRSKLERKKPLRRTPLTPRPKPAWAGGKDPDAWAAWEALRQQVLERSGGYCEAGVTPECRDRGRLFNRLGGHQAHHRQKRSQGGPDAVENLLALCGYCHAYVHEHPTESYGGGWMVRGSHPDPGQVPVLLPLPRIVRLLPDATYLVLPDSEASA